jgi:ApaG protein
MSLSVKLPQTPYLTRSEGIAIAVIPHFLESESNLELGHYVYSYTITIANEGTTPVQLIARKWIIKDSFNNTEVVEGDGVVGQQPRLEPGTSFTYSSFCPLRTPSGSMEGHYEMLNLISGFKFEAKIGQFYLVAPELMN